MTPGLLLSKAFASSKQEVSIVSGVLVTLIFLPLIILASVTNLGALADQNVRLYDGPVSTTNTYIFGYCTFWSAKRREEVGKPIPNNWGDAHTWDDRAASAGYVVDHIPVLHAIFQSDTGALGHVAFVEKVNPDGSWEISEMNNRGWNMVNPRQFKASEASKYKFIH